MKRWKWLVAVTALSILAGLLGQWGSATLATAGTGGEKQITILAGGKIVEWTQTIHRKTLDRVRWINLDDRGYTFYFTKGDWPFVEPPEPITVRAGEKSRWYTVYASPANDGTHSYDYDPPVSASKSGGPDTPSVEVGE